MTFAIILGITMVDGTLDLYKQNDIHAIKWTERAHKLLIRIGENPIRLER
jgi:hypothetical protein